MGTEDSGYVLNQAGMTSYSPSSQRRLRTDEEVAEMIDLDKIYLNKVQPNGRDQPGDCTVF